MHNDIKNENESDRITISSKDLIATITGENVKEVEEDMDFEEYNLADLLWSSACATANQVYKFTYVYNIFTIFIYIYIYIYLIKYIIVCMSVLFLYIYIYNYILYI